MQQDEQNNPKPLDENMKDEVDLIIVLYIDCNNMPPSKRYECIEIVLDRISRFKRDGVEFMLLESDHNDIKAIPVKCYLEGNIPDTPDELIDGLKEFLQKQSEE